MTKKLKKRINKIVIGTTSTMLGIVALCVIGAKSFLAPLSSLEMSNADMGISSENIEIITGNPSNMQMALANTTTASNGAIICDSLVQGVYSNDLPDGNYTFRVVRKSRKYYRN